MTQRINSLKQGHQLIKVPTTAVFLVYDLVYDQDPREPHTPLMGYRIHAWPEIRFLEASIARNMSQRVQLTVLYTWSGETVRASCLYEGMPDILLSPPLLKKSENSVVSVGKSEKSPEKIL